MMEKMILVGGGGHAKSIIDSVRSLNKFHIVGFVDKKDTNPGIKRLGDDEVLSSLYNSGIKKAFIAVGSIGKPNVRIRLYNTLKNIGYKFPTIIDKTASVAGNAVIEEGTFVGKGAVVNSGTVIRKQCIINSGAIVEHDCIINEFVHLAPGAILSGGVSIGKRTHVGANAVIIQNIKVGEDVLIGAGSVIIRNVKNDIKIYGNPGKEVGSNE